MEKSCISCHNDPDRKSPKKDWQVGDVGGVFKIGHRLESKPPSRKVIRGAFGMMLGAALLLVGFGVAVAFRGRKWWRTTDPG